MNEKFLSLEAYGFGATDNKPHEYYFEINLFETVNVEVNKLSALQTSLLNMIKQFMCAFRVPFQPSLDNISSAGKQLHFILHKQNPNIWWARLTAQPQKQNWIHVSAIND